MALFNYECDEVKRKIEEVKPNYPQLTTYESEWLYFHEQHYNPGTPVELEYETINVNPYGTVLNAIPHNYKSAILKGLSLVNLLKANKDNYVITINSDNWSVEDGYLKCVSTTGWHTITDKLSSSIKPDTKYLIIIEIKENTLNMDIKFDTFGAMLNTIYPILTFNPNEVGTKKTILTTPSTIPTTRNGFFRLPLNIANANSIFKFRIMAIEYQDGMENWDIPYFEGMQSVKMPVLTTSNEDGTKTNTLTVNEDVTLRSNGGVYDELDLLTGKLTQRIDENGEVLSQEVIKTVDLTPLNNPYEGVNHYELTSNIPCEAILEVPVVSTGKQTLEEIND